jgi:hypothetical protein
VNDELPIELIEGAPAIVSDVAQNYGHTQHPITRDRLDPKYMVTRIIVELGAHLKRIAFPFENRQDFSFESVMMLPRPLNLGPDSAKVDSHSSPRGIE